MSMLMHSQGGLKTQGLVMNGTHQTQSSQTFCCHLRHLLWTQAAPLTSPQVSKWTQTGSLTCTVHVHVFHVQDLGNITFTNLLSFEL